MAISPTEWQNTLLNIPEDMNLALFGGRGAGRTTGALFCATRHCEVHGQGARVLFLRQTLRSLREVEDNFQLLLASGYGSGLRVNRQDHEFRLPNHSTIEFAPLNDNEDMAKLQGRSFSMIVADEYGNFSPMQQKFVDALRANLRAGTIPTRMILLANPGGRGHSAIKKRFVDRMHGGMPTILEDGTLWVLAPANFENNPHNPAGYANDLFAAAGKDKELYRAWAKGAWNIARGAMFADCIDEMVHKFRLENLRGPNDSMFNPNMPGLHSFVAADWGQSAPAVGYGAVKVLRPYGIFPRGSLLLLDEVSSADPDDLGSGMNWSLGRFADAMQDMCTRTGVYRRGCIDDARGLSAEDTLIKGFEPYGFTLERPMKNRRSGWSAMREMLVNAQEKNGRPGLWVSNRCDNWWQTVPVLARDQHNPEDVDTKSIDHAADGSRYAVTYEVREGRINTVKQTLARFGIGGPGAPSLG